MEPRSPVAPRGPRGPGTYQRGLEQQLAALHGHLVGVGQRRPEGQDLLVGEDLQGPGLAPLVERHGLPTDAQPQLAGERLVSTLRGGTGVRCMLGDGGLFTL